MEPVGGRPRSVGVPARRTPVSATRLSATVRCRLAALVCGRTAVNGGLRVVYPFLPVIAHGLGLPFAVVAGLVAARSMAGLAGPAIARGMRRAHLRTPMLACLHHGRVPPDRGALAGFVRHAPGAGRRRVRGDRPGPAAVRPAPAGMDPGDGPGRCPRSRLRPGRDRLGAVAGRHGAGRGAADRHGRVAQPVPGGGGVGCRRVRRGRSSRSRLDRGRRVVRAERAAGDPARRGGNPPGRARTSGPAGPDRPKGVRRRGTGRGVRGSLLRRVRRVVGGRPAAVGGRDRGLGGRDRGR